MCGNNFPEQLANSINKSIKTKKHTDDPKKTSLEKKLAGFQPKPVPKTKRKLVSSSNLGEINLADSHGQINAGQPCLDTNLSDILNMKDNKSTSGNDANLNLFDFNNINNSIGNEEISYLADYFSEPAFESLYGAMTNNMPQTIYNPKPMELNVANTVIDNVAERLETNEVVTTSDETKVSISESRKSMIVIAKSRQELNKVEKALKTTPQVRNDNLQVNEPTVSLLNSSQQVQFISEVKKPINPQTEQLIQKVKSPLSGKNKLKRKRGGGDEYFEDFTSNIKFELEPLG